MKKLTDPQIGYLKTYHSKKIILFGLRAKGYATKYSDVTLDLSPDFQAKRKLKESIDKSSFFTKKLYKSSLQSTFH
ncbi:hypothetical protein NitYY0814_C0142 [Nitratiruptor sp. YY08-14]|nr:hypothetical protein NitYY0810_C0142 [Nitratiruptor sp. YY08-10]BCD63330.1 hypothetical protein NitYY0814_C0142 [Nitratiruptor sp. YY08-14]